MSQPGEEGGQPLGGQLVSSALAVRVRHVSKWNGGMSFTSPEYLQGSAITEMLLQKATP